MHILLIGLSVVALAGAAMSQPALPDQGAAPPSSNSNMGDGVGAGPAGSIGDPNGSGPGSAAPSPAPAPMTVERPIREERRSQRATRCPEVLSGDPARETMRRVASAEP